MGSFIHTGGTPTATGPRKLAAGYVWKGSCSTKTIEHDRSFELHGTYSVSAIWRQSTSSSLEV
jgi:hypothetical protein